MSALCSAKAVGEKRKCTWDVFQPALRGCAWGPRPGDGPGSCSLVLAWSRLSSPSGVLSPPSPTLDMATVGWCPPPGPAPAAALAQVPCPAAGRRASRRR